MSRSTRFIVRPSNTPGWFVVVDSQTNQVVAEVKGRTDANRRARSLNGPAIPSQPVGYISVQCDGCDAALYIRPGDEPRCPQCERERQATEDRIAWEELREKELADRRLAWTPEDIEFLGATTAFAAAR